MNNKERADKVKSLLGLNGEDGKYYRVADLLCDLMHFCNEHPIFEPDQIDYNFNNELERAYRFYEEETVE